MNKLQEHKYLLIIVAHVMAIMDVLIYLKIHLMLWHIHVVYNNFVNIQINVVRLFVILIQYCSLDIDCHMR